MEPTGIAFAKWIRENGYEIGQISRCWIKDARSKNFRFLTDEELWDEYVKSLDV